ncbi:MAG: hypothetical protein LBN30_09720 [Oscillospiraceae bacterium]|jgi:hypothetical protein|nr:hypothetical protein [Oscillospiraceae bacterium]
MAQLNTSSNYYALVEMLQLIRVIHDNGALDALRGISEVSEDDFLEIALTALENAAPICTMEEIPMTADEEPVPDYEPGDTYIDCEHWHTKCSFTSPEMLEYYRLCRLFEYREGIEPEDNIYVTEAEAHYVNCLRRAQGHYCAGYDDDRHTTRLVFESCPDYDYSLPDIVWEVRDTLAYYAENVNTLARDIALGRFVYLPALPAYKGDA